ncbi:hypothetical protein [Salinimicrobium soli]|uniref:hypothetical protein n=1 Tax=Salinimicrobium soli TaxID=1254399 RepID=UPI003AADA95A
MDLKVIESLLEKYLNAETSLKEEEKLRAYFSSGQVAPHLQEYSPMFSYFSRAKEEKYSGKVAYKPGKRKVYSWVAVAASIMILLGVVAQKESQVSEFGTYEDPELAMQKTREALQMVSMYMNDGTEDLSYLQEFNTTTDKIVQNP